MKLTSGIRLRGHLTIRILDRTGREKERIEILNTICEGTELTLERLLSQETGVYIPNENRLWAIYAGTDNTPPAHDDTALGAQAYAKACVQPMIVSEGGVAGLLVCQMTMPAGGGPAENGNGNTFQEAGLYTRGDDDDPAVTVGALMLARQIHSAITKDSSISIEYTWRFQIVA